jgi:hypothetical protein
MDIDTYDDKRDSEVICYVGSNDLAKLVDSGRIQKTVFQNKPSQVDLTVTVDFDKSEIQKRHLEGNRYDDLMDAMAELVRLTEFILNGDVESPEMAENICQVGKAINTYRYFEEIRDQYQ